MFLEPEMFGELSNRDMAYSNVGPIPLHREQAPPRNSSERSGTGQEKRPPQQSTKQFFPSGSERRDAPGRGAGRPNSKPSGMIDPYDIDIAPLNVFENQVIPVGIHNLSKSFRPNMATIRVLSLGTKFIPKWRDPNLKNTFSKFGDFNRRMHNGMFFSEISPGTYRLDNKFHLKSHFVSPETFNEVNEFCWLLRDGISDLVENIIKHDSSSNLGKKEKRALHTLVTEKNRIHVINDTDKNLGPANADKSDVINECKRQLYDVDTYVKLSLEEMEKFLQDSIAALRRTVNHHFYLGNCSQKEKEFLLSNVFNYAIPHFYIIWKILKNPIVGRPIVAGYRWIFTPASIFAGHFLKEFYTKFDSILNDSLSLVKLLEISRFDKNCFLFTIDFKSLYTNIPVNDAINCIRKLCFEYQNVIPNAHFVIELLDLVLNSSLMVFNGEYFQQIFGLIMGTNVAPILTNIYMAMLENELKQKCNSDPKLIWPVLFKRFIDDGFGITLGLREDVIYWIEKFNELRESIKIDKYNWGNALDYMDLFIYKGSNFYEDGKLSISIHQKETNKFMYIPYRSYHQRHTIKNYVWGELRRYVRYNTEEKNFKKLRVRFFLRLRNRGFRKYTLKKLFSKITYAQRNELLKKDTPLSNAFYSVTLQEAEKRVILDGERMWAASQEETEAVETTAGLAHSNSTNNNNNITNQDSMAEISRHSRALSPEGWNLVFSPPWFCIYQKIIKFLTHFLMCIYVSSEEAEKEKRKKKICLVLPGYMQRLKKPIDYLKKCCAAKIGSRYARFKRLTDSHNICIVYQNEPSIKKLIVRTKILN